MRTKNRSYNINWNKQNKIALRNFTENVDFHDVVKTLLVRMLRRKYPDSRRVPIYTEYDPEKPNQHYPDIWMQIKGEIIVWEIQDKISKKWEEQIIEQYQEVDLIIVPLNKLSKNLDKLKEQLQDYIV